MRNMWLVFAAVLGSLVGPSCLVNNDQSLVIIGLGPLTPGNDCQPTASTTLFRSRGLIDLNVARAYFVLPVVRNAMTPSVNATQGQIEGRTVIVEGVNVKYRTGDLGVQIPSKYAFTLGSVEPNNGILALGAQVLNLADIDILRGAPALAGGGEGEIVINLQVTGRMLNGGSVATAETAFPIRICRGCLRTPPPQGSCTEAVEPIEVCNVGQDERTDCRTYDASVR
jgi:hypothetical protein